MKNNKNFRFTLLFIIVALFSEFSIFAKEDFIYVSVEKADIQEGTGFFSKKITEVNYGTKLLVLDDTSNKKWIQISLPDTRETGWISVNNISRRKITNLFAQAGASDKELALAGKGFSEQEMKKSAANFKDLVIIEKQSVSNEEVENFIIDGNLRTNYNE